MASSLGFIRAHKIVLVIPLIALSVVLWRTSASKTSTFVTTAVTEGPIVQEVLATGHLESPSATDLHFKSSGKLTLLKVKTGRRVTAGEVLAREDTSVLSAQLAQAFAALSGANAQLAKIRSGATIETVALSEAGVSVANRAVENAYKGVDVSLSDAYAKANDAVKNQLASFFANADTANPRLTFQVSDASIETDITAQLVQINAELSTWQTELTTVSGATDALVLDIALSHADKHLEHIRAFLTLAGRAASANTGLSTLTAVALRTSANSGLSEVNAAVSLITGVEQTIRGAKANLEQAKAALDLTKHTSTQNDIAGAEAMVAEAQAAVNSIRAQMNDLELVAPFSGIVTDTEGNVGEVVTPSLAIVSLMPDTKLDIKTNIAEGNIVGVRVGQKASVTLDAFPRSTIFYGKVSDIDPAETVVGGGVYYQASIFFDRDYPDLRPGMTANVRIETGSSSSALLVPASALIVSATGTEVLVMSGGNTEQRPVVIGLSAQNGMVEVLEGLQKGDQVVIGTK